MNQEKAQLQKLLDRAAKLRPVAKRYALPAFIVFVLLVYGVVLLRINSLNNQEPTTDQVTSQVKAARIPHIDQSVVQQLQSLQDNSVSVQALFNQARNNPFQ
ncbi:MAG TPA: hypothetical protein VHC21_01440 [Candidatus Saccharimonadales bacterium]|nr:hypothetical protein [Candidatus Saccharimonadales bacterium]